MGFELGSGFLAMIDRESGEIFDLGEVAPLEIEYEEWSKDEEPAKVIKGLTNSAIFSCESPTIFNQNLFNELLTPSSSEFAMEWDTKIFIQARWHKRARIRKKWLKRYGYKEDVVKTIAKARQGEYNTDTGECSIDVDSIQYMCRPDQMRRGLDIKFSLGV